MLLNSLIHYGRYIRDISRFERLDTSRIPYLYYWAYLSIYGPSASLKLQWYIYHSSCNHIIPVLPFEPLPAPIFHPQLAGVDNISAVTWESLEIGAMAGCVLMLVYLTKGYF